MADNEKAFTSAPGLHDNRVLERASDGKFYYKFHELMSEFGGVYEPSQVSAALALDVPTGKKFHLRTLVIATLDGVNPLEVTLRDVTSVGTKKLVTSFDGTALTDLRGIVFSGDIYCAVSSALSGLAISFGGVLDADPDRI